MSWDLLLLNVPLDIISAKDIPGDFDAVVGPKPEILSVLRKICPDIDLTDPNWGVLRRDDFSIEFNLGNGDPLRAIGLAVRGGDRAIRIIQKICEKTGCRAVDFATGEFIDFDFDPAQGLREWRQYRDRVIVQKKSDGK